VKGRRSKSGWFLLEKKRVWGEGGTERAGRNPDPRPRRRRGEEEIRQWKGGVEGGGGEGRGEGKIAPEVYKKATPNLLLRGVHTSNQWGRTGTDFR